MTNGRLLVIKCVVTQRPPKTLRYSGIDITNMASQWSSKVEDAVDEAEQDMQEIFLGITL